MNLSSERHAILLDILRWRRDIRHFSTRKLDPAAIEQIEASVDYAPSVGNSRPWRIVRVNDLARRGKIAASFEQQNQKASQIYEGETQNNYLSLKLAGLRDAPTHLAFFTDPTPAAGRGLGRQTMPETLVYSTIMAIHTLWLTARALNIGVGWVSILDAETVKSALETPPSWQLTAYLCIGYPEQDFDTPELQRVGWQANTPTVWLDR